MAGKEHPTLTRYLKEADPAEKPLPEDRAAELKTRILAKAMADVRPKDVLLPRLALGLAFGCLLGFALWWQYSNTGSPPEQVLQTASHQGSPYENLRDTRVSELRFTTASGTRIIWQFQKEAPSKLDPNKP